MQGRRKLAKRFGLQFTLALATLGHANQQARAQYAPADTPNFNESPVLSRTFAAALNSADDDSFGTSRNNALRLPRMMPGFISDPPALAFFDDDAPDDTATATRGMTVSFGPDNPYFEPRLAGDPGGFGYLRVYSQVQVADLGSTSVCLGMQAWTPAGLENGGVSQGPTMFSPGIGIYQGVGMGVGLHGFVDQTYRTLHESCNTHYGMAVQCPLHEWERPEDQSVFFYVQMLGMTAPMTDRYYRETSYQCSPGIHWQISDTFSMQFGAAHQSFLTCSWKY